MVEYAQSVAEIVLRRKGGGEADGLCIASICGGPAKSDGKECQETSTAGGRWDKGRGGKWGRYYLNSSL